MTDFDSAIEYADKAIEKAKLYSDYSFEDILLLKQNKLSSLTNNYDFEAAMPLVAEIELAIKNNELPRDSYFYAYAQLKKIGKANDAVICVPSGNFGNITAGLLVTYGIACEAFHCCQ